MSFFSKKPLENTKISVDTSMLIKTMRDDLNTVSGVVYQEGSSLKQNYSQVPVKNTVQKEVSIDTNQNEPINENPFISQEQTQNIESSSLTVETAPEIHALAMNSDTSIANNPDDKARISKIVIISIILIVLISIGGIYYFIKTRSTPVVDSQQNKEPIVQQEQPPVEKEKLPLFSADTPNYLPIDALNSTPQSMGTLLVETAQQVADLNETKPVEFILTDTTNTPISFTLFTQLFGINFSQKTLLSLNDTFSIFIYTNNHVPRVGVSVEIKDKNTLQEATLQEEPTFIQTIAPLFLSESPLQATSVFHDGKYKDVPLRYMNINPDTNLSIDYAIINQHFIIGTSMETHHALLDIFQ